MNFVNPLSQMAPHVSSFVAMGTPCEIRLFAPGDADGPSLVGADQARQLAELAISDVRRLEARYSRYRDDSDLSAINRVAATGGTIEVDEETGALLDYAHACHRQSDGLFDITSGILRQAWRFASGQLPDPAHVARLQARIGWDRVQWQAPRLAFPVAGMELDFGGIVKEYAVDRAAALLQREGVRHGFINLGGDVRAIGPQPDGSPWRIGIRHPRVPGTLLTTINLSAGALASSGDYERCIVVDGVRYGHILNPRTGWPVRTLTAVSVAAPLCVLAGSAATITLLKEDEGIAWLQALALPCVWVTADGECGGSLAMPPLP